MEDYSKSSFKDLRQSSDKIKLFEKSNQKLQPKKDNNIGPQTVRIYNNISKRIWIQRREALVKRPLIVIIFDGLMGNFVKSPINETMLFIRKGLIEGLKLLSTNYQVAVFTHMREDYKIKFFIQALKNKKVVLDAVYRKLGEDSDYDVYD